MMKTRNMFAVVAVCACLGSALGMTDTQSVSTLVSPESQGVSSVAVKRWVDACTQAGLSNGFRGGYLHGFVLLRHGRKIAEGTWAPQNTLEQPHMLFSHSKSFTSCAIGFLVDDGKIDLDTRVIKLLPDKAPAKPSENLKALRVRDLLTMNTGSVQRDAMNNDVKGDWLKALLAVDFKYDSGTRFQYDSGATHLLAAIVERVSGKPLMEFLKERLFTPLGMTSPWTTTSPAGIACGGWGMNMTTRDLATFGQFILQEGRWNGRQLLSREYARLATSRQTWNGGVIGQAKSSASASDWAQGYGFQFWRCRYGAYRADGAAGQLTVFFPEQDAVLSVNAGLGDMQAELNLIWKYLLPAFGVAPLPADPAAEKALRTTCAQLALPFQGNRHDVFEGMDKATVTKTAEGWLLKKDDRTLAVGRGTWARTRWFYSDNRIEPIPGKYGRPEIAASGTVTAKGTLCVTWQYLGGIRYGRFEVPCSPENR